MLGWLIAANVLQAVVTGVAVAALCSRSHREASAHFACLPPALVYMLALAGVCVAAGAWWVYGQREAVQVPAWQFWVWLAAYCAWNAAFCVNMAFRWKVAAYIALGMPVLAAAASAVLTGASTRGVMLQFAGLRSYSILFVCRFSELAWRCSELAWAPVGPGRPPG